MSQTFDKISSIAFFIIGILFVTEATQISDSAYGSTVGPKTFPLGLGIVLIFLRNLETSCEVKNSEKHRNAFKNNIH